MSKIGLVWCLLLVAVLGAPGTGTCAGEEAFKSFDVQIRTFTLRDFAGNVMGNATLEAVQRMRPTKSTCFRMNFNAHDPFTIVKLRTGIWVKGDSIPFSTKRFTKRRDFRDGETVTKARIDTCPTRIASIDTASCCDSDFEVVGYAVFGINQSNSLRRGWLASDFNCRQLRPGKAFQFACTVELECTPACPSDTCRIGSDCLTIGSPASSAALNCRPTEEVAVNDKGECTCRKCSNSQCFNSDSQTCAEISDFVATCAAGETLDPDADTCTCECAPTEGKCVHNSICGTDVASVSCPPTNEVAVNDKGECTCRKCSNSQCFNSDSQTCDEISDFVATCATGETLDPDADTCTCECAPTEGKCIYNGICGTDVASVSCPPTNEVAVNDKGECTCRKCSNSQCFNSDSQTCNEISDFVATCATGETLDPDADTCTCECAPTEGKCIYNGICGTDVASVSCPPTNEVAVNDKGECTCRKCSNSQCFNSDSQTCNEISDFVATCATGETLDPDADTCTCECAPTEGKCIYNGICGTDVASVSCPPTNELVVNGEGECICRECSDFECFNGLSCISHASALSVCPRPQGFDPEEAVCTCIVVTRCPLGQHLHYGMCKPLSCPSGQVLDATGFCRPGCSDFECFDGLSCISHASALSVCPRPQLSVRVLLLPGVLLASICTTGCVNLFLALLARFSTQPGSASPPDQITGFCKLLSYPPGQFYATYEGI
ncbi:hypothetical protein NDN08_004874 [Rhodosorus marinus]|uniref:Uncharacterized protein n=1 Tax=Rhodosorus marinus TaxID=101924 RepID=A0AAV8UIK8_9RHOD|nr:hypothetical protein NDN08_004874 [Rhodosorus marinus]